MFVGRLEDAVIAMGEMPSFNIKSNIVFGLEKDLQYKIEF